MEYVDGEMIRIKPNEIQLQGGLKAGDCPPEFDEVSERIFFLVQDYLIPITSDDSGWNCLYQDPADLRYWELSYPVSELHGGGAPSLKNISIEEVRVTYGAYLDGV